MAKLITVGLQEDTHRRLKIMCAKEGLTMTEAVDALLKAARENGRKKLPDPEQRPTSFSDLLGSEDGTE